MERIIEGVVVEGRRLGRELGFPTANIPIDEGACERCVYRTQVKIEGIEEVFDAMSNVGFNPSVGGSELRLESHLLDYDGGSLYGVSLRITLLKLLRPEQKVENIEQLRRQIEEDVCRARLYFGGLR